MGENSPNLVTLALDWIILICFLAIWNIICTFGILYDRLVHFVFIWYIFPVFGILYQKNLATLLGGGSISRPVAPVSSVAGEDDTTKPHNQG
jgi:hypothetical protein